MVARPRMKMLTTCVGLAIAQWGAGSALADSAVGVDMALGNALNPPGRSAVPRPLASDGFDTVRHSPTGQLYGLPYDSPPDDSNKTATGWEYSGGVEAGVLGGAAGEKNALFRKYKDLKNGLSLNYFEVEADKPASANYIQTFGGGTGQHDQFYGVQFGRYNDWKVRLFYNETLHVFTDTWKSLHQGEGSGDLTTGLPAPSPYAPATTTAIGTAASSLGLTAFGTGNCTLTAPCWVYDGKLYSNASAVNAINGVAGTYGGAAGTTLTAGSPQSNMAKAIANKLASIPESELSLVRKKGGARVDMILTDNWKGYSSYSQEHRQGARPFAMNEGNFSTEIAEPIDYTSHEFLGGLQYTDARTHANLRASLSLFRNNISTLNVRDTLMSENTVSGAVQSGTYDLYPDNQAFNLKGEFARSLPDFYKGRFTAALSWGTSRQDDALLAPISALQNAQFAAAGITTLAGNSIGYAAGSALVSNWNTTAALSQQTAKQRIDNTLLDLGLSVKPTDDFSLKSSFRLYDTANKGGYTAYNPLTGQFGRGFADGNNLTALDTIVGLKPGATPGTAGSCYVPPGYASNTLIATCQFGLAGVVANGSNVPVFGQARSTKQVNYGLAADYDLSRTSSLNASLEREDFNRDFRERDKTWEDKLKLGYVNRALGDASLRTSLEKDRKRGSDYNYRTFADLGTGLPGLSPQEQIAAIQAGVVGYTLNANLFNRYSYYFRKYDQADRDQNIFNARLNLLAREDLDLGASVQLKNIQYPGSVYGAEQDKQNSLTLDLNYQPSSAQTFYAFYSYQKGKKSMSLNSGVASATNTACTLANLTAYGYSACADNVGGSNGARPLSSGWTSDTDDRNNVLGLGLQSEIGRVQLGVDYTYSNSATNISYGYGGTALSNVAATQAAAALIAGSALPNMTFVQQTLNLNLLIPISKKLSVRLFDRLELGSVRDWHYDGVISGAVANYDAGTLLLDSGPQSYHTNVIGVFVQYKL
ncbi:MAG: MtrB/PioB family outer membrane beta-barrel protein [Comamonadaceae bacterium]